MKCDNPISIKLDPEKAGKNGINWVPVPCGKCYNCKQRRVQQWSVRLMKELEVSTSAHFITLTYDTMYVPITENHFMTLQKSIIKLEREIGETQQEYRSRCQKRDEKDVSAQGFFKRLRYYEGCNRSLYNTKTKEIEKQKPIRYYACGEYGGVKSRPHYHVILFNLVYNKSVDSAWPFGNIDWSECNQNTINYTLKYINKDGKGKKHANDDREREFALMSKKMGMSFITPEIESFYNRRLDINYLVMDGIKVAMPKYYRDKMMTDETKEDAMVHIKRNIEENEKAEEAMALKKCINLDAKKQQSKFYRQALMSNYQKRNKV